MIRLFRVSGLSREFFCSGRVGGTLPAIAALVVLMLSASASVAGAAEIRRQLLAEPESLDPQSITGSTDFDVVEDLFEGLTAQAADGSIIPGIAERWEVDGDRLGWTFHLRPGLVWSDGDKLTADDVVWSMRRAVDPHTISPYAAALDPLRNAEAIIRGKRPPETLGVSAPDPRTVRILLKEPTPFLPGLLAQPVAYPLPREIIKRWGPDWTRPGHLVGNGAFVLSSWTPEAGIVLEPNTHYHDAVAGQVSRIEWIVADDRRAALRRYRAGELDAVSLAAEDFGWARTALPRELRSTALLATRYLVLNMARPPLGTSPALRQALSMAIDRDLLVGKIDTRGQVAAWGFVPPDMPGYAPQRPAYADDSQKQRDEAARALLAADKAPDPAALRITLLVEQDDVDHRIAEAVRAMWQAVLGVQVTLEAHEWRVFNAQFHQGNFDIALFGWYADYADPWNFLANWRSDAGPLNPGAYRSAAFDGILDEARLADGAERMTLLEKGEQRLLADHPLIPLEFVVSQKLVKPRIEGWKADPFDMNLDRFLSVGE